MSSLVIRRGDGPCATYASVMLTYDVLYCTHEST